VGNGLQNKKKCFLPEAVPILYQHMCKPGVNPCKWALDCVGLDIIGENRTHVLSRGVPIN
jgi:hypothetical protein